MEEQGRVRAIAGCVRRAIIAALSTALGLSLLVPGARAQDEVRRGQTVNERARPAYDAKGIPAGGFILYPLLDLSERYNDNIFAAPSGEIEDFETLIGPQLSLISRWSRHELALRGYGLVHRYIDRTEQDTSEYGANARFRLDLARQGALRGSAEFQRRTVDRTDPEEARRASPEQVDVIRGAASFTQPFVNLRLTLSGDAVNYEEVSELDRDKDRTKYTGRARLGYESSPALTAFVQAFYTMRDYDRNSDPAGLDLNRDSKIYGGVFGLGYDITGILYGETSAGYYKTDFEDVRFKEDSGVFVSSETTWNVTTLTSIIVRVARENITTNEIIAGLASSSRRQMRAGVELQHELTKNVIINANAGFTREKFLEIARTEETFEAGANIRLLLNNYVELFAAYRYSNRNSDLLTEEFTVNRVVVGIVGKL